MDFCFRLWYNLPYMKHESVSSGAEGRGNIFPGRIIFFTGKEKTIMELSKIKGLERTGENRYSMEREDKPAVDMYLHIPEKTGAPLIVNMHGGGWVGGDATLMETFCTLLCERMNAFVVNLNYQKRPLKPFPFASEEVCDTVKFFRSHADELGIAADKTFIGGFSAGGQLAASAAVMLADDRIKLAGQYLVYPCTDMKRIIDMGDTFGYIRKYMFPDGGDDCREASPLLAVTSSLKEVCPAIFVLCGRDELLPHGTEYAKKLIDAGVEVAVRRYPDAFHGFVEVNRPDYPADDGRRSPEQEIMCHDAEEYLIAEMSRLAE